MFSSQGQNVMFVDDSDESVDDGPTEEELQEYADNIGIDPDNEPELMWIARAGITAPLPSDEWKAVESESGSLYFFNFRSGESSWEHPSDEKYRKMVEEERKKLQLRNKLSSNQKPEPKVQKKAPATAKKPEASPSAKPALGRLAPLGPITDAQPDPKPKAGRLTPLGGGPNTNKPTSPGPIRNKPAAIGLGLTATNEAAARPKTSRGAQDRNPTPAEAPQLKGGGSKFLKSSKVEEPPPPPQQKEPEILTLSPRELQEYDIDRSSTDDESFANLNPDEFPVWDASKLEPVIILTETKNATPAKPQQPAVASVKPVTKPKPEFEDLDKSPAPGKVVSKPYTPAKQQTKEQPAAAKQPEAKQQKPELVKQAVNGKAEENKTEPQKEQQQQSKQEVKTISKELETQTKEAEEKLRKEHETKLKQIKDELEKEKRKTETETAAEKRKLQSEKEKKLTEIRSQHEKELKQAVEEAKTKHEQLIQKEIAQFEKERKKFLEHEKNGISDQYEQDLNDLKAEFEDKLNKNRKELKEKIANQESESSPKSISFSHRHCQTDKLQTATRSSQTIEQEAPPVQPPPILTPANNQLDTRVEKLTEMVSSMQAQMLDMNANLGELKRSSSAVTPPLATSTPRQKSAADNESVDDLLSTSIEPSVLERNFMNGSLDHVDVLKRAKEYLNRQVVKEHQMDSGFDKSTLSERPKPNDEIATPLAKAIQASLDQMQSDLRVLSSRIGTSQSYLPPPTTSILPSEIDAFIDSRWQSFNQNSESPLISQNHKNGLSAKNEAFDSQLASLKQWLREFETKIAHP